MSAHRIFRGGRDELGSRYQSVHHTLGGGRVSSNPMLHPGRARLSGMGHVDGRNVSGKHYPAHMLAATTSWSIKDALSIAISFLALIVASLAYLANYRLARRVAERSGRLHA